MVNRFLAGIGSFFLVYAISRTTPAVVEAISGVRYAVIFTSALAISHIRPDLLKETFSGWVLAAKLTATGLVIAGLAVIGLGGGNSGAGAN